MFNEQFKKRIWKTLLFFILYTLAFVLFKETIKYTLPFVLAFAIASLAKPFTTFLIRRLRFTNWLAAIVSTLIAFGSFFGLIIFLIYKISSEATALLNSISIEHVQNVLVDAVNCVDEFLRVLDPQLMNDLVQQAKAIGEVFYGATQAVLSAIVSATSGIPYVLLLVVTTLIATYFMIKELPKFSNQFMSIFKPDIQKHIEEIWIQVKHMIFGYMKATMMLILMSGFISFVGFVILDIEYAFLLGFFCVILDLLPIVGMAIIYLAIGLSYLFQGNTFVAIGLLILYVIVVVVRQVLEPKFISDSIGLHPISVIVALFVGLTAYGFIGVIYLISLMVVYTVLRRADVI